MCAQNGRTLQTELFAKAAPKPRTPISFERHLHDVFGFTDFRHGQRMLIEAIASGRDALGVMPTGGGKSLCFQLPALALDGVAIVISPLIALMKDQVDALKAKGVAAEAFNSALSMAEKSEILRKLEAGLIRLLYIAPERIQSDGFITRLKRVKISFLAVDEAHCISHWGHDFRPDYMRLNELRTALGNPPCIALTATATKRVQDDIVARLKLRDPARVVTGFHRPNLSFEVRHCASRSTKVSELRSLIGQATVDGGNAIIYAATRKNVEWLASALNQAGIRTGYYHAGLNDDERDAVQDHFFNSKLKVLVATNAFGMGIDKSNVRLVAHFDIPGSMEAYYQEAGRAGRDGAPARCVLLFNHADVATQEFFIDKGEDAQSEIGKSLLKQLVRYAYGKDCREHMILDYFGDEDALAIQRCERCDRCRTNEEVLIEVSDRAQSGGHDILRCVDRMGGRFGKSRVAEVLKGSNSAAVRTMGLKHLPTYGLLRGWTLAEIRGLLDQLVESRYLEVNGLEYPVVGLSAAGREALKSGAKLLVKKR